MLPILTIALIVAVSVYVYLKKERSSYNRPQEPNGPYSYVTDDVSFLNKSANVTLSGTLTIPSQHNGNLAAVVLISGYGPQIGMLNGLVTNHF